MNKILDYLIRLIFVTNDGDVNQGDEMSKEQVVSDGVQAIQSGVAQVYRDELGKAYDQGVAEAPVGGDPSKIYSQEELDAIIGQKLAEDEVIDQAKIDELAGMIAGLEAEKAEKQAQYDALAAKEQVEAAQLESLKSSKEKLQAVVDYLSALMSPPQPEPEPVQE